MREPTGANAPSRLAAAEATAQAATQDAKKSAELAAELKGKLAIAGTGIAAKTPKTTVKKTAAKE